VGRYKPIILATYWLSHPQSNTCLPISYHHNAWLTSLVFQPPCTYDANTIITTPDSYLDVIRGFGSKIR